MIIQEPGAWGSSLSLILEGASPRGGPDPLLPAVPCAVGTPGRQSPDALGRAPPTGPKPQRWGLVRVPGPPLPHPRPAQLWVGSEFTSLTFSQAGVCSLSQETGLSLMLFLKTTCFSGLWQPGRMPAILHAAPSVIHGARGKLEAPRYCGVRSPRVTAVRAQGIPDGSGTVPGAWHRARPVIGAQRVWFERTEVSG